MLAVVLLITVYTDGEECDCCYLVLYVSFVVTLARGWWKGYSRAAYLWAEVGSRCCQGRGVDARVRVMVRSIIVALFALKFEGGGSAIAVEADQSFYEMNFTSRLCCLRRRFYILNR